MQEMEVEMQEMEERGVNEVMPISCSFLLASYEKCGGILQTEETRPRMTLEISTARDFLSLGICDRRSAIAHL